MNAEVITIEWVYIDNDCTSLEYLSSQGQVG